MHHVQLIPELNLLLGEGVESTKDVREAALAMFQSAEYLAAFGGQRPVEDSDKAAARAVVAGAVDVEEVQTPQSAIHLKALVDEYDRQVVDSFVQVRQFIINRLIEEAAPGSRGAIRALEMLGKISGVDLFTERTEITVRTQSSQELQVMVRETLARLSRESDVEDGEFRPAGAQLEAEPVPAVVGDPFEASREALHALTHRD